MKLQTISIRYAVGYGVGLGRHDKRPGEKTLTVELDDLGLSPGASDEKIVDAVWEAVVDDIRQNASAMDVLDDLDAVIASVRTALKAGR